MGDVRIGVIGTGGMGQAHLRLLAELDGAKVVALADTDGARARSAAERHDVADVHTDTQEMLDREDIDAVFVCTPTAVHAAPAIAAMRAGKDVFVEKPMEATLEAATEMVRVSHETGRMLMVGLKLRFSPQVAAAKAMIDDGQLGRVYYSEAVADRVRNTPGGSFIRKDLAGAGATADLGVYALDTTLFLLGSPKPVSVSSITSNFISLNAGPVLGASSLYPHEMEVEDFAAAWIRFEDGSCMVLKTSWSLNLDTLGGTYLLGERGGLRIGVHEVRGTEEGVQLYRDEFGAMTKVALQGVPYADNTELVRREQAAFVSAVRDQAPSPIDAEGVLLTNVIIQGVFDSAAKDGAEVAVSVPDTKGPRAGG